MINQDKKALALSKFSAKKITIMEICRVLHDEIYSAAQIEACVSFHWNFVSVFVHQNQRMLKLPLYSVWFCFADLRQKLLGFDVVRSNPSNLKGN
jgi:hypothetical protein|mmetsp:Transcript_4195/g.7744  ORF Transcript_4195/g.7744 Transcript_4195/m.7744 type:complete len:95 (-) Transcript_4195:690-974(-)